MLKNKWLWIGIILFSILLIVGKVYMDKKEEETNALEIENLAVGVLKNEFSGIDEIHFLKVVYDPKTGTYGIRVTLTNEENKSLEFSYTFWKKVNKMSGYVLLDKEIQKKGNTAKQVKVIYLNGEKDTI